MATINLNELAKEIALEEGGWQELPIGQIKEVMRITLTKLARMDEADRQKIYKKYLNPPSPFIDKKKKTKKK